MTPKNIHVTEDCRTISDVSGARRRQVVDSWSSGRLGKQTMRFNELRRDIGGILPVTC